MFFCDDNPSPRQRRAPQSWAALVLFAFTLSSPLLAQPGDSPPRPLAPPAPPAPPAAPQGPASKDVPGPAAGDDQRMLDFAKRMATTDPKAAEAPGLPDGPKLPGDPASRRGLPATAAASSDALSADKSNRQKLADPDDQRLLGARGRGDTSITTTPPSPAGSTLLTVLTALGVVITLIFVTRAGLRRVLGGAVAASHSPVVQVLTRVAVAPRSHVLLLRVGGRILVVSDSPTGMRTLSEIENPEEVADLLTSVSSSKTSSATAGFRQLLSSFGNAYPPGKSELAIEGADENEFHVDRTRDQVSGLLGKLRNLAGKGGGT